MDTKLNEFDFMNVQMAFEFFITEHLMDNPDCEDTKEMCDEYLATQKKLELILKTNLN